MAKQKTDSRTIIGRCITAIFVLILLGGIYFLVDLFRARDISVESLAGQWKYQRGDKIVFYTFVPDVSGEQKGTAICTENGTTRNYTFTLEPTDGGNGYYELVMTRSERGNHDAPESYVIDQISRAQMSILMRGTSYESMTKVNIF